MFARMALSSQRERHNRVLELPEIISGALVLFVLLWMVFFQGSDWDDLHRHFIRGTYVMLSGLVWFNAVTVAAHFVRELVNRRSPGRLLWVQLVVVAASATLFILPYAGCLHAWLEWAHVCCCLGIGGFAVIRSYLHRRARHQSIVRGHASWWSPAVSFFTYMLALVFVSTLVMLTPGATHHPISLTQAFFSCASATSITGLDCVNMAQTFTMAGKVVLLIDIQVGAVGVMTFTYMVLLMLGRRLAVRDSMTMSGVLDQQGVNIGSLLKTVFSVTLATELVGAAFLYFLWQDSPGIPQEHLLGYAIFHAVSAFCNAGITLFPDGMSHVGVLGNFGAQGVMIVMMLVGTLGFGVYLEILERIRAHLHHNRIPRRWSTHAWFVLRVTVVVLLVGTVVLSLLGMLEPSAHAKGLYSVWEGFWNAVSRSAGFNLSDTDAFGPVYKLFMCVLMFVGGNPAGTGGGVYAPVVCLCLLEVWRVLRGQQDVEMHGRRIARSTIERAMATVVLSITWIVLTTMLLLLLEPEIAADPQGALRMLFLEVSAYTTTGFDLGVAPHLSPVSRCIVALNMLFGRVGMFTFMLIFIKQKDPAPLRYPETRLPLN